MRKANRILLSSGDEENKGLLAPQEKLQEVYEILEREYVNLSNAELCSKPVQRNYAAGLHFATVYLDSITSIGRVLAIDFGTQLSPNNLESFVKSFSLPFDLGRVRYE
jgi:predicted ATP-grasp superfamily ATP-dependent carboligase